MAKVAIEAANRRTAKLARSLSGLTPRVRRPIRRKEAAKIIKNARKIHHLKFKCPQGGKLPGGRGDTKELFEAVVLMVRVDVAAFVPSNVSPGGE